MNDLRYRFVDDHSGREEDQGSLNCSRNVFDLAPTIWIFLVRGAPGHSHREVGDHGGKQIYGGVNTFGHNTYRTDIQPDGELTHGEDGVGGNGKSSDASLRAEHEETLLR